MAVYGDVLVKQATMVAQRPWRAVAKDINERVKQMSPDRKPRTLRILGGTAVAVYLVAGVATAAGAIGMDRAVEDVSGNTVVNLFGDALFAAELAIGGSQLQTIVHRRGRIQPDDIEIPIASSITYTYENFQDNPAA